MSDSWKLDAATPAFGRRPADLPKPTLEDIVDAEFEVVFAPGAADRPIAEAPAVEPPLPPRTESPTRAPQLDGMEMLRRRMRAAPPAPATRGGPVFWISGVAIACAAFWVSGGHALFSPALFAPSAQPAAGLRIASVVSRVDRSGLRPVLQIDGTAANDSGASEAMPALAIEVVSPVGGSTHYKLGTAGSRLESGAIFAFSSRLDMPKDGVKTVLVTFAN